MKLVILCSNDIFAGILAYPLFKNRAQDIAVVLAQSDGRIHGKTPWQTLKFVASKSGWRYPLYQAVELLGYRCIARIRHWLKLNREPDRYLALPRTLAREFNVAYRTVNSIHEPHQLDYIRSLSPDLIISLRFGQIVRLDLLSIPKQGIINFHASMLPRYAGLGSVFQALNQGDNQIGCTVHRMDQGIDTGEILVQDAIPVRRIQSTSRVYIQAHIGGARVVAKAVSHIEQSLSPPLTDKSTPSYFSWPRKSEIGQYINQGGKLISITDFLWLLFKYNDTAEFVSDMEVPSI